MKKGAHGHYFIPFNRYNPQIFDSNQALYVVRSKVWFYLPDRHEAHPQERILVQGSHLRALICVTMELLHDCWLRL